MMEFLNYQIKETEWEDNEEEKAGKMEERFVTSFNEIYLSVGRECN